MAKSILICRTSTSRQEIDNQIKETKEFALADGKSENDLILLAKHGASAIKIDKAYQENMERVYREIEAGGVECVYAWALDRIGRNEVVMMQFKEFLVKHGVQLKIKNPALVLLNNDGTVNSGMEVAFTLYITLAKQEMEQKKARFERTRKAKLEKQQHTGGRVLYGYMVDDNGYMTPDPEKAPHVQDAFAKYATGDYSIEKLAEKMKYCGWSDCNPENLFRVLTNRAYIGEHQLFKCPAIIDNETWEQCRQVAAKKATKIGSTKQYWLGARLITCPECKHHYVVWKSNATTAIYRCLQHGKNRGCSNDVTINARNMDALLYEVALPLEFARLKKQLNVNKEVLNAELNEIHREIDSRQDEYDKRVKKSIERVKVLFIDGVIDKEEFDERSAKAIAKADDLKARIDKLRIEADRKQRQIDSASVGGRAENIFGYNIAMSAEEVSQMVHRNIIDVELKRLGERETLVTIQTTTGEQKYIYTAMKRSNNWQEWHGNGKHTSFDVAKMEKHGELITFSNPRKPSKPSMTDEDFAALVNENE